MSQSRPSVLITGANRGLGLEMAKQYAADGWQVQATCRSPGTAGELDKLLQARSNITVFELDVADFAAIDHLASQLDDQPLDLLVNNAGLFGPKPGAEKDFRQRFGQLDYTIWTDLFRVNTQAPVKLAEALLGNLRRGQHRRIVSLSSTEGSITESESRLMAYPSTKTALNMAMACLARDLGPEFTVVTVNPGWVKTDMGGPAAPLTAADSVRSMREVIAGLTPADNGQFIDYDGRRIPS